MEEGTGKMKLKNLVAYLRGLQVAFPELTNDFPIVVVFTDDHMDYVSKGDDFLVKSVRVNAERRWLEVSV
jgi:hypothetical protein